jgi:hypothetical protein
MIAERREGESDKYCKSAAAAVHSVGARAEIGRQVEGKSKAFVYREASFVLAPCLGFFVHSLEHRATSTYAK